MTKDTVKSYTLYKLRFWIGYSILTLLLIAIFVFAVVYVPGGLTSSEQHSALQSASLRLSDPASLLVVDMPYHALQKLSTSLLGVSSFSIKLPSLVLGIITALGIIVVLTRRFSRTVSILTGGIMMVSAQFITLVSTGTPTIMMVTWPVLLLLIASLGIKNRTLHPLAVYCGSIVAALSLFTPFSVYILIALLAGGFLHPHIRYLFRKTPRSAVIVGGGVMTAAVALLLYASYLHPFFAAQLTYRSSHFSLDILANIKLLAMQLIDISSSTTASTGLLAPVFGLTVLAITVIGIYSLYYWRHSVTSYIVFTWTLLTIPILLINPTSLALLIVPIAILVAAGSNYVLRYWYKLFPRNPYARTFALAPIAILFACVIFSGTTRYFYAYHYYAPLANASSSDLQLIEKELVQMPSATLLVSRDEKAFYQLYADTHGSQQTLRVTDRVSDVLGQGVVSTDVIATRTSSLPSMTITPREIIATDRLHMPSDRLYIYKKPADNTH